MQQATDFLTESRALAEVLRLLDEQDFFRKTQFKGWTIDDVLGHLHMFNHAADLTLQDGALFETFFARITAELQAGKTLLQSQYPWLGGLKGRALFEAWEKGSEDLARNYLRADPKQRVKWAGPEMSALSSITARQMETWAHGHEVFDLLGVKRQETDRIKNIVFLGVNTFGWTYINRKMPVPDVMPFLELTAPSGAVWTWGEQNNEERITGSALGFAQVVTQTRNVADTDLQVEGDTAQEWMQIAQCFAGGVAQPPAPGTRCLQGG